jgi:methyl-accepting chemotaxis protein
MNGLNDGFDKAEEHAGNFYQLIDEISQLESVHRDQYQSMKAPFKEYYNVGKRMAKTYVEKGPEGGNQLMNQFDKAAEALIVHVDNILESSNNNMLQRLDHQQNQMNNTISSIFVASIILGMVMVIIFLLGKNVLNLLPRISRKTNKLASGNMCDFSLDIERSDELGDFVKDIKKMYASLNSIVQELTQSSGQLMQNVDELSSAATQTKKVYAGTGKSGASNCFGH